MKRPYQVGRRAFLAGVGAAAGMRVLLGNLEAAAQELASPPRFLMMFWPVGTVRYFFVPEGTGLAGAPYTASRILQPFDDAGLHDDTIVLYGLTMSGIDAGCSGGSEGGVVLASTGANIPGTRSNGGEADDALAGGPSFDQIFLNRVPSLQRPGQGYANAICDARVDSNETSSRCLSYSYTTRSVEAVRDATCNTPAGALIENTPLLPYVSPFDLYSEVFGSFAPDAERDEILAGLRRRQSVLDHTLGGLERLRTLAPSEQWEKIDQHAEIVRKMEQQLAAQIEGTPMLCEFPEAPDAGITGQTGSFSDYVNSITDQRDDLIHQQVGALHMSILRAAFQCDLLRVATFQWSPSTNHVSFFGLHPEYPDANVMHHPMSHRINNRGAVMDALPSDASQAATVEFLANVQTWYNRETAALLNQFKVLDVHGGNLFDHTIFPFITDTAETTHSRSPAPALIFGGKALGMRGGQYLDFQSASRSHNDLWMTIAQAYRQTDDPLPAFEEDVFYKTGVAPIEGLWSPVG